MGLQTQDIQSATQTLNNLAENGVTFNMSLDDSTIKSTGTYLIMATAIGGAIMALVQFALRKAFG